MEAGPRAARGRQKVARAIRSFVENPVTILVKGIALFVIGIAEASRTLAYDLAHKHLSVGHGLIVIGIFNILDTLPHFLGGLEESQRYLELRDRRALGDPDRAAASIGSSCESTDRLDRSAGGRDTR